jgi:transposase
VAYWRDDEGNHGQLLLPQKVIYGLVKVDELRSIRDKIFDETKALLKRWFDEHPRDGEPRQIDERLDRARQYLSRWRDQKKLSMLVKGWIKEERSEEHELLVTLAAWEKQDRHLLFWQSQQRDRRIGLRRETFKVFAATMARKYAEIVVEGDFHLPDVREQTPAEDGVPSDGKAQRRTADIAAPGELREYLKRAAEKYGATFTKIKAAYSTQIDNPDGGGCGAVSELNASSDVFVTCSLCGHLFDQDDNACRNLLAFARKGRIAA